MDRSGIAEASMHLAVFLLFVIVSYPAWAAGDEDGAAVYRDHCAQCHESGVARAPSIAALKQMLPDRIGTALVLGSMSTQGRDLTGAQLKSVVRFLAGAPAAPEPPLTDARCRDTSPIPEDAATEPHWNGWGVDLTQHRFQPAVMAKLSAEDVPRLKLKWAFGFPGETSASAQPTVFGGRLFVGSGSGKVYALDAKTGCIRWVFDADLRVRTAITIGQSQQGWTAFLGNVRADAFAIDAETGTLRWKTYVAEHPAAIVRGAPSLAGNVLYVPTSSAEEVLAADPRYPCCTFRGGITALDAATGKLLWRSYAIAAAPEPVRKSAAGTQLWGPSGAGIWSSPTVDLKQQMVYATTGDSYSDPAGDASDAFVAFRMATGERTWVRQMTAGDAFTVGCELPTPVNCPQTKGPDFDFGSSPILVDLANGKRALIAGQKSGMVHAIDPDREGAILWQTRVGRGSAFGSVQWGSAVDSDHVYVAVSDVAPHVVAAGEPGAQKGVFGGVNFRLDPTVGGGLFALSLETGEVVWHTPHPGCGDVPGCSPAQSAAVTAIPGIVFSGGLDGHLRAYAAKTGAIVWDVDTKQAYEAVDRVPAHGGSLDGPGAVVVNGMLYVNSGYAFFGTTPGNVLLAFSVDGQ
jgi:polyvinyl alcohol dehydrogenase (cytochrome)